MRRPAELVSIHARVCGRRSLVLVVPVRIVSIHARVCGRLHRRWWTRRGRSFNSRPRVRATGRVIAVFPATHVSIHARVCGRLRRGRIRRSPSAVSIHARVCGRPFLFVLSPVVDVSIHARVCGRHVAGAHSMHIWRFNSRPRVRATHRGSEERKIHPLFQFTPACAGDDPPRRCVGRGASFNSRPRVRATTPDFVLVYFGACFNSRPRVRATMRLCNGNEVYRVSIHARVCGRLPARRRARVDGKVSIHARVCGRQRQQT